MPLHFSICDGRVCFGPSTHQLTFPLVLSILLVNHLARLSSQMMQYTLSVPMQIVSLFFKFKVFTMYLNIRYFLRPQNNWISRV